MAYISIKELYKSNYCNYYYYCFTIYYLLCHCILLYFMYSASSAIIASTHCSEVVHFTSPKHLPMVWKLSSWVAATTVFAFLLRWWSVHCFFQHILLYSGPVFCNLNASKSLVSFKLSSIAFWVLWASILLAHANTCTLVTELVSTIVVGCLMI